MKVFNWIELCVFSLFVAACNTESTNDIEGTWKIVKFETEFAMKTDVLYDGVNEIPREPYESDHWTFYGDSLMESHYPIYADRFHKYQIVEERSALATENIYNEMNFSKRFSGDTLILKRRNPKYFETYYLLKQEVDTDQIALLQSIGVDWSYCRKKWQYSRFIESSGMKCPRNFPQIIDLTPANSEVYKLEGNMLSYWEKDSLHRFEFSSMFDDEINFKHVCDSGCQYMWLEYKLAN